MAERDEEDEQYANALEQLRVDGFATHPALGQVTIMALLPLGARVEYVSQRDDHQLKQTFVMKHYLTALPADHMGRGADVTPEPPEALHPLQARPALAHLPNSLRPPPPHA